MEDFFVNKYKIKSRKERLKRYNEAYPRRFYDADRCLRDYFEERGWDYEKAEEKAIKKLKKIAKERKYETIRIIMYEYPMKTERPRASTVGSFTHIYSPNAKANHKYSEKAIQDLVTQLQLIATPTEVEVDAYFAMPNNVKPDEVILFENKAIQVAGESDADNIFKCYTDIQNDVILSDDDVIWSAISHKYYSVLPRVEIRITYIKSHESDYIYGKITERKRIKEAIKDGRIEVEKIEYEE